MGTTRVGGFDCGFDLSVFVRMQTPVGWTNSWTNLSPELVRQENRPVAGFSGSGRTVPAIGPGLPGRLRWRRQWANRPGKHSAAAFVRNHERAAKGKQTLP